MNEYYPVNYPELITKKSVGTTSCEKKLAALGYNTFLSLWSYPNPYKVQPGGKELCDLLVIFENSIIIFSDKDCRYGETGDARVDWCRWYKRAIKKSVEQLLGARLWIKEHPDRITLDAKNEIPFPLEIQITPQTEFHLIAIAHGAMKQCKKYFSGGDGGLIINNRIVGNMHTEATCEPFCIGFPDSKSENFIHIFDDASYATVLKELDTIRDFLNYLRNRKTFLLSKHIIATSENGILAQHLSGLIDGNPCLLSQLSQENFTDTILDVGLWEELISSPRYIRWRERLAPSYFLDNLLQRTFFFIENGLSAYTTAPSLQMQNQLFCRLAKEDRAHRLALSDSILSFFSKTPSDYRGTRIIYSESEPDICYVLFLLPRIHADSDETYRKMRRDMLADYCVITKADFPNVVQIIGIAHESSDSEYSSEDFIALDASEWSDEDQEAALSLKREYQEHGLLAERKYSSVCYLGPETMKGRDRNKLCPCGSGKKFKKCCGRYL